MYRRRRVQREKIAFGFDCFLDLVCNLIGIILRLILVAWVGARAYKTTMELHEDEPAPSALAAPVAPAKPPSPPHPLEGEIASARTGLDEARGQLLSFLDERDKARSKTGAARIKVEDLKKEHDVLLWSARQEEAGLTEEKGKVSLVALSLAGLRERSQAMRAEIRALEKEPTPKKLLRFRTPVSRAVEGDELMFECRGGRVSFVDVPAFLHEIKNGINDAKIEEIGKLGTFTSTTSPVGAFRLRYTFQAQEAPFGAREGVRIRLTQWVVEPVALSRGETAEESLQENSDFRRLADGLDSERTTVTFWVYPDSFTLFRALRDQLYRGGVEVAGRPLPLDHPMGASIFGTKSRGQ